VVVVDHIDHGEAGVKPIGINLPRLYPLNFQASAFDRLPLV
jgi:hypothetical protein